MKNKTTIEIEAKIKAFTGQGRRNHKLSISPDGTVRVWDDVAGALHHLPRDERRNPEPRSQSR